MSRFTAFLATLLLWGSCCAFTDIDSSEDTETDAILKNKCTDHANNAGGCCAYIDRGKYQIISKETDQSKYVDTSDLSNIIWHCLGNLNTYYMGDLKSEAEQCRKIKGSPEWASQQTGNPKLWAEWNDLKLEVPSVIDGSTEWNQFNKVVFTSNDVPTENKEACEACCKDWDCTQNKDKNGNFDPQTCDGARLDKPAF